MANAECPLCSKEKEQAKNVVCFGCYQLYTSLAGRTLAREGRIIPFTLWIKEGVEKKLLPLRSQLEELRERYAQLQQEVRQEAYTAITSALGGEKVEDGVFRFALQEKRDEIWRIKGGNRLHWEMKTLEARVTLLEGIFQELQEKIEAMELVSPQQKEAMSPEELDKLWGEIPPESPEETREDPDKNPPRNTHPKVKGDELKKRSSSSI